jgi:putative ABC transport system substrate-binding protein
VKRREFIAGLGGAAALPLVARAQSERVRRIGVLMGADDADLRAIYAAFVETLQRLGWTDGRNVQIETRWATGHASDYRRHATDLIALAPEVIVANSIPSLASLLQATQTVPIVFTTVNDPVGAGLIQSMAHPGGNATGFVQFEYTLSGKWLELLKEIAPGVKRTAVLRDPEITAGIGQFAVIQSVAPALGMEVTAINLRDAGDIERARHGICRLPKWRPHLDVKHIGSGASRTDHRACCQAQTARGLLPALLRRQRRFDLLWL